MIRSIPANAADSLYCMQLAQNAVHGAMAGKCTQKGRGECHSSTLTDTTLLSSFLSCYQHLGYTGFSVGLCSNRMVFLPIPELVATSPRNMNPRGRTWERVLAVTRQPNTVPPLKPGEVDYSSHAPMLR